jgi:hypothetical protein
VLVGLLYFSRFPPVEALDLDLLYKISQWFEKSKLLSYQGDGGALATWNDQGIARGQLLRRADFNTLDVAALQMGSGTSQGHQVLCEASLQGQHADFEYHLLV